MSRDWKKIEKFPVGIIEVPPSKSVLHRVAICSGLAGEIIPNKNYSDDVVATINGLKNILDKKGIVDCGESGSTLRFLIPVALVLGIKVKFFGHGRLFKRPMEEYYRELQLHGGNIELGENSVTVSGKLLPSIYTLPGNISSQYISGLLMALPLANGNSTLIIEGQMASFPYVDITLDVMKNYGVEIKNIENGYEIKGGRRYLKSTIPEEGDWSGAAFFLVAAALGRDVKVSGLNWNSKQGDKRIVDILEACGCKVIRDKDGDIKVEGAKSQDEQVIKDKLEEEKQDAILNNLNGKYKMINHKNELEGYPTGKRIKGIDIDMSDIPDLVPPVAALLSFANGTSHLTGISRLKYKESNRIVSISEGLKALGADIKANDNEIVINGREYLQGGRVNSYGDHRIAMMAAVAAIGCKEDVYVSDPECVRKSYPDFWKDFEKDAK
ncbi:MAG: 3-phosphoshikimate 1-carboxyvinyltransferase [Lachnospiraceae bacterium]|jgi:3-phosphoshikimate 1-carboxyvinyltransferase|nr:3-phosphoshikimate 1-carboxyvinyltransferase [Lachnospiraceae bacterium]